MDLKQRVEDSLNELMAAIKDEIRAELASKVMAMFDSKEEPEKTIYHRNKENKKIMEELTEIFQKHPNRGFSVKDLATTLKSKEATIQRQCSYLEVAKTLEKIGKDTYRLFKTRIEVIDATKSGKRGKRKNDDELRSSVLDIVSKKPIGLWVLRNVVKVRYDRLKDFVITAEKEGLLKKIDDGRYAISTYQE